MGRVLEAICGVSLAMVTVAAQPAVRRVQLQKTAPAMVSPTTYQMGERRDPKTGKTTSYDPKPRVVTVDARSGLVRLTWVGIDGKAKSIAYQRPDAIDVIVKADLVGDSPGVREYRYRLDVLHNSRAHLSSFVVQSFAPSIQPVSEFGRYAGRMNARAFPIGQWAYFGLQSRQSPPVLPGSAVTFRLRSSLAPGLVECRVAGGPLGLKGVGEEMPQELAAVLLGYEAWPHGYTIGPDDRLKGLSPAQRAQRLVEWLPEFERQGWMTAERRRHYEASARRGDLRTLAAVVDTDLRAERITTEVRAIVLGLADLLGK